MDICNLCGKYTDVTRVNCFGQELIQNSMIFRNDLHVCNECKSNFTLMKTKYDLRCKRNELKLIDEFI